ncbi:MAG: LuxR C-terminal-related transcriptional regulator [Propionicimonas sp.]|nr:LuxR C-terminal-related transcriptional regulator [Propionicimonas sp.]
MRGDAPTPVVENLPRLPAVYIPRPRLWDALDEAAPGAVTVLSGPSGAGKTLGVAGWALGREDSTSIAWLRATDAITPAMLEPLLDPERLLIVDDAQKLSHACIRALDRRLDIRPESMRVLLLSLWDLPFTRLAPELFGQLSVLRGDLLRLDDQESEALVKAHLTRHPPDPALATELARTINEHARGWCAVVVLAARAVAGSPDPLALAHSYVQDGNSLADRVASEVLSRMTPQQRHLLLCVSTEPSVSAQTARELTNDPLAPDALAELRMTGLLVTRLPNDGAPDASPRYAVHPLLAEVVRRRVDAGGVDVARAVSTVTRAVRADLARNVTYRAFQRLAGMHADEAVVDLLERFGLRIGLAGHAAGLRDWAQRHSDLVDQRPSVWLPIALERWIAGDLNAALGRLDRILAGAATYPGQEAHRALARVMRAMLGLEPLREALLNGERAVAGIGPGHDAAAALLRGKLGAALGWAGYLDRAVVHLSEAVQLCRVSDLEAALPGVLSDLAMIQYTRGQEYTAGCTAAEARACLASREMPWPVAEGRLSVAESLVSTSSLGEYGSPARPAGELTVPKPDNLALFWHQILRSRQALLAGSVVSAARILAEPVNTPPAPRSLRIVLETERALVAAVAGDIQGLDALERSLVALGAPGEAALAKAMRADRSGDVRGACAALAIAIAAGSATQPDTRSLARTLNAQLLDALGQEEAAHRELELALLATEVRRNAIPFLDWSWHGTRVVRLLETHLREWRSDWGEEVLARLGRQEGFSGLVATLGPGRPQHGTEPRGPAPSAPPLSPREQDVLYELARGATYADIAETLSVSENTVKTHVSSLYRKLDATRRSSALAAARAMRLI